MDRDSSVIEMKAQMWEAVLESRADPDEFPPSDWSINTTEALLLASLAVWNSLYSNCEMPVGSVSADGNGGVRVEWVKADCNVHLCVPIGPRASFYLYVNICGTSECSAFPTPELLADKLAQCYHR